MSIYPGSAVRVVQFCAQRVRLYRRIDGEIGKIGWLLQQDSAGSDSGHPEGWPSRVSAKG